MKKLLQLASLCVLLSGLVVSCSPNEPNGFTITVNNKGNGTAVADKAKAEGGATITLTATPAEGAMFKQWTVTAGGTTVKDPAAASTTFTMPAANVEVTAEFEVDARTHTITVINDGNGTASADKNNAAYGETVTLTAVPAEGAAFKQWTVSADGVTVKEPTAASTTFTMPAADVDITAEFTGGTNVPVTSVKLDFAEATRIRNTTFKLRPTVLPENATNKNVTWESLDPTIATVSDKGVVTAIASGKATIRVKTADGGKIAKCALTVEKTCECAAPTVDDPGTVTFITNKTWIVGSQVWSDAVTAARCQKETYKGGHTFNNPDGLGNYQTDCRSNPGYGDLFSWCAVIRFQDKLCPEGWRIPTQKEFQQLDMAMGGTGYPRFFQTPEEAAIINETYLNPDKWGALLGGSCWYDGGGLDYQNGSVGYWGSTEDIKCNGAVLFINVVKDAIDPCVSPTDFAPLWDNGYQLRCIKDI